MQLEIFNLQFLWPLVILAGFAVIIPIFIDFTHLKFIPNFVIEIIIGFILAFIPFTRDLFIIKNTLSLNPLNEGIYEICLAVLFFLSGLDTDFSVFKREKKGENDVISIIPFCLTCIAFVIVLSIGCSFIFFKEIQSDKVLGIVLLAIFFSSTFASLVVPLVRDNIIGKTTIGKIISTYSTIAEIISIVGLSITLAIKSIGNKIWILAIILLIAGFIILIRKSRTIVKLFKVRFKKIKYLPIRAIAFVILISIILADIAGVEFILGSFIVGILLAFLGMKKTLIEELSLIGYGLFIPIFYMLAGFKIGLIIYGMGYEDFFTTKVLGLIALTFIILLATKLPLMSLAKYYTYKTYLPSLFIVTSTIVVALTIEHLSSEYDIFSEELIIAMIISSLISCTIPPSIFDYDKSFGEARGKYKPVIIEKSDFEETTLNK